MVDVFLPRSRAGTRGSHDTVRRSIAEVTLVFIRAAARSPNSMPPRNERELEAVAHAPLLEHCREHVLHGLQRQAELDRDLTIGPACGDTSHDVAFSRRQAKVASRSAAAVSFSRGIGRAI